MRYRINCSKCNALHELPVEEIDKRFTCSKCQTVMMVRLGTSPVDVEDKREPVCSTLANAGLSSTTESDPRALQEAISSISTQPERSSSKARNENISTERKRSATGRESFSLLLLGIIAASTLFAIIGSVLVFVSDSGAFAVMGFAMLLGGLVCVASNLWLVVISFQEHVKTGLLFLFLPLYSLYFIWTRWVLCRRSVLLAGSGVISIFAGLAIIGVRTFALPSKADNGVVASAYVREQVARNIPTAPRDTFNSIARAASPREVEKSTPSPPSAKFERTSPVERKQADFPSDPEMKESILSHGAPETPVPIPTPAFEPKAENVAPPVPLDKPNFEDPVNRIYQSGGQVPPTNREIPDNVVLPPGLIVQQKLDDSGVYVVAEVMDDSPDGHIVSRRLDTHLVQRLERKYYFLAPDEIDQPHVMPHHRASLMKALQDGSSYSPFGFVPSKKPGPIRKVVVPATSGSTETDIRDAILRKGDRVRVDWNGQLYNAEILSVEEDGQYRIHYSGFGEVWDEKVPRSRIKSMVRD